MWLDVTSLVKAAEKGLGIASSRLGDLCLNGRGREVDGNMAIYWYKKCIASGDKDANRGEYGIAKCYKKGIGVKKNLQTAIKWYKLSSSHNNPLACRELRLLRITKKRKKNV